MQHSLNTVFQLARRGAGGKRACRSRGSNAVGTLRGETSVFSSTATVARFGVFNVAKLVVFIAAQWEMERCTESASTADMLRRRDVAWAVLSSPAKHHEFGAALGESTTRKREAAEERRCCSCCCSCCGVDNSEEK